MKIEICIEGPRHAMAELYQTFQGLSPLWEETFEDGTRKEQNAGIGYFPFPPTGEPMVFSVNSLFT
jgi:hypothetical protein